MEKGMEKEKNVDSGKLKCESEYLNGKRIK